MAAGPGLATQPAASSAAAQPHAPLNQHELDYIQQLTSNQMALPLHQDAAQEQQNHTAVQMVQEIDEPLKLKNDMINKEATAPQGGVIIDEQIVPEIELQDENAKVDVQQLTPERLVGEDDNYEYYYVYEDEAGAGQAANAGQQ